MAAVALLLAAPTWAHAEANEFKSAQDMVTRYQQGGDILLLRVYIKGITDGFSVSNASLASSSHQPLFCPPNTLGLVDAQYVAILDSFLKKTPNVGNFAPGAVLLFALQDQFPCAK
ncbi:hypothetical protein [Bradyrhizobium sp. Ash2021]|uniref:hypothetical protein n=1 Tax=Bradyrhizobium sp. Ash2021 TaxID=2954771 RepID=UPI002814DA04|nr:hypothetical protein [Bradyrhizobium sp. Ash2021]WMT71917.1 hypothetical protein NL528_28065 [Bradyrhizobium sp. Ash2021]